MEKNHTLSPWTVEKFIGDKDNAVRLVIMNVQKGNFLEIADIVMDNAEAEENARLMAMAPLIPVLADALWMARRQLLEHYNIQECEALRVVDDAYKLFESQNS